MSMMKPNRLLVPALFGAVLGFAQPANAVTMIDVNLGSATVTCDASGVDPECLGYIGAGGPFSFSPPTPGLTLDVGVEAPSNADVWDVMPQNETTQLAALNTILGFDPGIVLGNVVKVDFGTESIANFDISPLVLYWSIKLGAGTAFFQNLASGITTLTIDYDAVGMRGGISNLTTFAIPLPAALPMFLLALGGAALVARRRRGVADAA